MTIYETVKAAVTVRTAAEHYGLEVNRNGMTCCPFHKDRHPSMKLYEDHFYCFGCGATGDVIDFTARLFGISTFEAVKKLAADFGIDPDKPLSAATLAKPRYPMIKAFREDELYCHRVLCDYLQLLESWKVLYAPKTPEEPWNDHFTEALQMHNNIEYLADVLTVGELEERVKAVEVLLKDGKMQELEARLERIGKEEQQGGRSRKRRFREMHRGPSGTTAKRSVRPAFARTFWKAIP